MGKYALSKSTKHFLVGLKDIPRKQFYALAVIVFTVLVGSGAFLPSIASATQQQICGNGGTGYCMNDWNNGGNNNEIRMDNGGGSNEDFYAESLYKCDNNTADYVTAVAEGDAQNCPFSTVSLDNALAGMPIFQIVYSPHGLCVGYPAGGTVGYQLTGCNNPNTGSGGGDGTVLIGSSYGGSTYCSSGSGIIDRYLSDYYGSADYLASSGNTGPNSYVGNVNGSQAGTCWGGLGGL